MLEEVPEHLWAKDSQDIGLISDVAPIYIELKPGQSPPKIPQYPLKPDAEHGTRSTRAAEGIMVAEIYTKA